MSVTKADRQFNLVLALQLTERGLTAEQVNKLVEGYGYPDTDHDQEAFKRTFERDKAELRELGIPLHSAMLSRINPVEVYRIKRDEYELPGIDLTAEEGAVAALAASLWNSPELSAATAQALIKLKAAGLEVSADSHMSLITTVPARSRGAEPALHTLVTASQQQLAVRFRHRASPTAEPIERTVEPWGVVTHGGRWYVVGHDQLRDARRTFRLSRIVGDVEVLDEPVTHPSPGGAALHDLVAEMLDRQTGVTASVWIATGKAQDLRRIGTSSQARSLGGRDGEVVDVSSNRREWLIRSCAAYGPDVVVVGPPDVRAAVVARLQQAAGQQAAGQPDAGETVDG